MSSGWNLWVCLPCIGVVSGVVVKWYKDILTIIIFESGWNLWVWLVGVVSRRWVWLVGGIYGYGYHV